MPRYELTDGSTSKFWQIDLDGDSFTTTFGKIGTSGQSKTKSFDDAEVAQKNYDKLIAQKTKKGYSAVAGATKKAAPKKVAAKKKVVAKKKAAKKKTSAKESPPKKKAGGALAVEGGWQRYEFRDGKSEKFWEVTFDDASFSTRYGRIGSDGKITTKPAANASQARASADKAAASKVKGGYKLVGGEFPEAAAPTSARNKKLEAMISKDPEDADAYLAYADWLQEQGDPRGELIMVQHALAAMPKNKKLLKAQEQLLSDYKEHFWGDVAPYAAEMTEDVVWSMGYIKSAKLKTTYERDPSFGDEGKMVKYEDVLRDFLALASSTFLQSLTLGIATMDQNDYSAAIKLIAEAKRPTIKSMFIGDFHCEETELNWSFVGFVEPLCKAVPNLEELTLRSGGLNAGKLAFPKLKSFTVIAGGISDKALSEIAQAKWPKLERLSVQLGNEMDSKKAFKALKPIFDAKGLKNVRHLGLGNFDASDELCTHLAKSKIAKQIEELDLSQGTLGDAGVAALVAEAKQFAKLTSIDVSENYVTNAGIKSLKALAKNVDGSHQEDDGGDVDDRYISAYE